MNLRSFSFTQHRILKFWKQGDTHRVRWNLKPVVAEWQAACDFFPLAAAFEISASKEQEVLNSTQKDDKHVSVDSSGTVGIRDKDSKLEADLSTDTLTRLAFTWRGWALDQANIFDYLEHNKWVEKLFDCKITTQPEGYSKVTLQQVINADCKLFKLPANSDFSIS